MVSAKLYALHYIMLILSSKYLSHKRFTIKTSFKNDMFTNERRQPNIHHDNTMVPVEKHMVQLTDIAN
jgi:hypothetical protein